MRIFLPRIVLVFFFLTLLCGQAMAQSPAAGTVTFTGQVTTNLPVTSSTGYATYRSDATSQATGQGFEFAIKGTAAANLSIDDNSTTSQN